MKKIIKIIIIFLLGILSGYYICINNPKKIFDTSYKAFQVGVYTTEELANTSLTNEFGITLVSLHDSFKEKYEPFSTDFNKRINALKLLHEHGFPTWVSIEPFPTPNIDDTPIEEILSSIKFVDKIVFGRLHYNKLVGQYPDYQNFYNSTANKVISFCKENNKHCHVKTGTLIINGKKIEADF